MQFEVIDAGRIEREWPVIAEILAPAVRSDPRQTLEGLHQRLANGADSLLSISGPGHALMVIEVSNSLACWIKYLAGQIEGGPKARTAIIRAAVDHIETIARASGCTEIRLCGRDWARVLPGFERSGERNELRKGL